MQIEAAAILEHFITLSYWRTKKVFANFFSTFVNVSLVLLLPVFIDWFVYFCVRKAKVKAWGETK